MKTNETNNDCIGRIVLEGLPNTRDLGGYRTMDGRRILPRKLIRSGALYEATKKDIQILEKQCCLGMVIDFRTQTERCQKPDPDIEGIDNIFNPILDEKTVGITFEEEGKTPLDGLILHASSLGGKPETYVDKLYEDLVLHDHAANYYGRFFELLLNADERAVLWHCSVGKDRVGIGTALLFAALGVERNIILSDFVKTNDYIMKRAEFTAGLVREKTGDQILADCVRVLLTVSKGYLLHAFDAMEKSYGSIDLYLKERIGMTKEKKDLLKRKFLTDGKGNA